MAAIYWLGRRDWPMLGRFIAWGLGLTALSFVLEPAGTIAFLTFPKFELVGEVTNLSPYAISPVLWAVSVVALAVAAVAARADARRLVDGAPAFGPRDTAPAPVPILIALRHSTGSDEYTRRLDCPRHGTCPQLTIVLPAYNEAERIGPALDELFGYLEHRNPVGRDGAPGAAALPDSIEVLVVDDGSSDGTADLVRARPETTPNAGSRDDACGCSSCPTPARAPRCAPGCSRRSPTSSSSPTPTWRPRPISSRCSSKPSRRTTSRSARGSSRTARTCARRSRGTGGCSGRLFHLLASIWVVGPVKDTQCGFKGFRREVAHDLFARQQITSIVFDVELIFLARKRGYSLAVIPIRWADKRGSRMRARFGLAIRVAWDLFRIPLVHRRVGRVAAAPSHDEL